MKFELEDVVGHRLRALVSIEENKKRVARWYDKKVKVKEFADGDLVWKLIFYRLGLKVQSLESGLLIGKVHIG
jgi:hypothetical protein